ncbi:MAG: hypothetical protein LBU70_07530, partial [Chitinispirillales bacterium]|nr:hypothetical protein [Chitinispirillales bacterium]
MIGGYNAKNRPINPAAIDLNVKIKAFKVFKIKIFKIKFFFGDRGSKFPLSIIMQGVHCTPSLTSSIV